MQYTAQNIDVTYDDWDREEWVFDVYCSARGFIGRYAARSQACIDILIKALNHE